MLNLSDPAALQDLTLRLSGGKEKHSKYFQYSAHLNQHWFLAFFPQIR